MLKFLVEPNRNASFSDIPFLYDHIYGLVWSSPVLVYPYNPLYFHVGEMQCNCCTSCCHSVMFSHVPHHGSAALLCIFTTLFCIKMTITFHILIFRYIGRFIIFYFFQFTKTIQWLHYMPGSSSSCILSYTKWIQ